MEAEGTKADSGENIPPISGHELRRDGVFPAPKRTESGIPRERKAMHDISNTKPQVKWGVIGKVDTDMLRDMGVAYLDDDTHSSVEELTPPSTRPKTPGSASGRSRRSTRSRTGTPTRADDFVLHKRNGQEVPGGRDCFMDLSDESILEIFKWLSKAVLVKCALVCKRWMRLAFDESLWRRLDLGKKHVGCGVLGTVLGRGAVALKLAMAELHSQPLKCYVRTYIIVQIRGPAFEDRAPNPADLRTSKLQYLDLSMATVGTETLRELMAACTQLRKLSLEHCTVDDATCGLIAGNVHLECLNTSMCEGLTAEGVRAVARGCQRLRSWNLAWTRLSPEALHALVREATPELRQLNLAGCGAALSDSHVHVLVRRCPDLVDLDVSDATKLGGPAVEAVVANLRHLRHLHVSRCYNVPPATYLLLSKMPSLLNLEIFGVLTEAALHTLRRGLPHVEINKHVFSTVARPTTGIHRTSIWGLRVRD